MNPLFHPHLVNDSQGDPTLFIDIRFDRRALFFDLGEIISLQPRKILRVSHLFITHTHMDHFIGFDHLLRICLGRDKVVHCFGPPRFIDHLEHRLSAYSWNLVKNYPSKFDLIAFEVHPDATFRKGCFRSSQAFARETLPGGVISRGILHEEEAFIIKAAFLDHKIPCLGFALEERFHINILEPKLTEMGLPKGSWLKELKKALWKDEADEKPIVISWRQGGEVMKRELKLGLLRERLVRITPGQKISYVVDTILNRKTHQAILDLIQGSDQLFIEAAFLEADLDRAREKFHLTAKQAGRLAREGGVKEIIPCHFSPKYSQNLEVLRKEALAAFRG
jgi:ribonuclease Z